MKLFNLITDRSTLLTPNRRLSAILSKKYSDWKIQQGHKTWKTLDILPLYPSWLERFWHRYTASHVEEHPLLLSSRQEQVLWEKIIRASPENDGLLQLSETAKLAKSAWEILKKWRCPLKSGWYGTHDTVDTKAILKWADLFETACKKNNWLSPSDLASVVVNLIHENKILLPEKIILAGFTEIAPQYEFLLNEFQKKGVEVLRFEFEDENQSAHYISLTDHETEIRTMAQWAKGLLLQNKDLFIGCIVPNLESCRDQIVRIFSETMETDYFNISAGKKLSSYPIIHDAFAFLKMNLLDSPFIASNVSEKLIHDMIEKELNNKKTTRLTTEWINIFNDYLKTLGWPGERSLNSHEYQVIQHAWLPLLQEFASLSNLLGKVHFTEALHYLSLMAQNVMFQPESPEAPIQILGLLEAADIPFDYSWVMGLTDAAWPSRPKPNPFIPLFLQKKLRMPNASAERELIYCQTLTHQLKRSSKHIIFSYPMHQEDVELRPSSLIKSFIQFPLSELKVAPCINIANELFLSSQLEQVFDNNAPEISDREKIQGGAKIFKSQAECAFKAFSEMRLHIKIDSKNNLGLSKLEQGNAIHQALQFIWNELKHSEQLHKQSDAELSNLIKKASQHALDKENITQRFYPLELLRLEKLLWQWLQLEKTRPPFNVIALEKEMTATIGKISAKFRIDRIDEVVTESEETKQLIIDYKTGKNIEPKHWFGERLEEPQLPIYTLINSSIPVGIAFAKINAAEMKFLGASQSQMNIPSIKTVSEIKNADAPLWEMQMEKWREYLTQLSQDFYEGKAYVNPKHKDICDRCGLQSLCRIHEIDL